jgi:phage shock protein B
MDTGKLAIIMVFSIPLVAIIGGMMITVLKILKGNSGREKGMNGEEAQMMQELIHIASRMEKRVEALETLLMDTKRDFSGSGAHRDEGSR